MKTCWKAQLSKKPHHVGASQLIFPECQMTGLHTTHDLTERRSRGDHKIIRTVKNCLKCIKIVKTVVKKLF